MLSINKRDCPSIDGVMISFWRVARRWLVLCLASSDTCTVDFPLFTYKWKDSLRKQETNTRWKGLVVRERRMKDGREGDTWIGNCCCGGFSSSLKPPALLRGLACIIVNTLPSRARRCTYPFLWFTFLFPPVIASALSGSLLQEMWASVDK